MGKGCETCCTNGDAKTDYVADPNNNTPNMYGENGHRRSGNPNPHARQSRDYNKTSTGLIVTKNNEDNLQR